MVSESLACYCLKLKQISFQTGFDFVLISALEVFKRYALHKSMFYLLTYLLTYLIVVSETEVGEVGPGKR